MPYRAVRIDSTDKLAAHSDGLPPFSAFSVDNLSPVIIWDEMAGGPPEPLRLQAALEIFPWRDGKDRSGYMGQCMLTTSMPDVFIEVIPGDHWLNRLGFSISDTLYCRLRTEQAEAREAACPGYNDLRARMWSHDTEVAIAAIAEFKSGGYKPSSPPVPFETVIKDTIHAAFRECVAVLHEAYIHVLAPEQEDVMTLSEKARMRVVLDAMRSQADDEEVSALTP